MSAETEKPSGQASSQTSKKNSSGVLKDTQTGWLLEPEEDHSISLDETDLASTCFNKRDFVLSPADAASGGPSDMSVTGEEDPGAALEFLVKEDCAYAGSDK